VGDSAVVMKMAEDDLCEELLLEAEIYQALQTIQGSVVPTCLGVYSGSGALFLLTDDVGVSPNSFLDLEIDQRCVHFKNHHWPTHAFDFSLQTSSSQVTTCYTPAGSEAQ
jgi:hypothetical protein